MDQSSAHFWRCMGRAFGGALLFALPLLMTMEMWEFGFYLERLRIAIFVAVLLPVLVGLSYYSGFEETFDLAEDAIDALVAFAVGAVFSSGFLLVLSLLGPGMSINVILGKTILLTVPSSIGALIANKQLGQDAEEEQVAAAGYGGELFIMVAGALLLAFNVAPTEEMVLIGYKMTVWHALALAVLTLVVMHAIVYAVGFKGQESGPEGMRFWRLFSQYTLVGYALALLVSAYVLWTFARFEGSSLDMSVMITLVLSFPAGVGAAVSRLVI